MRKFPAVIIAVCLVLLISACGNEGSSIGIIGGADGPTAIIITGPDGFDDSDSAVNDGTDETESSSDIMETPVPNAVLPEEIVAEYTYNNDEFFTYSMTVKALDGKGGVMWEYVSPVSPVGQCESLQYLGMESGLVYISEINVSDDPVVDVMSFSESRLRALNAENGSVVWDNTEFHGSGASAVFDDEGNIYAAGYFGPDCMKIGKSGETIWIVESVDPDLYWVYDVAIENGEAVVSYEMNAEGNGQKVRFSADGEVIG